MKDLLFGAWDRFLTTAELRLLEAAQGVGMQGTGVSTECALGQLQGVIPGPGQQPTQTAVTSQELSTEVPAGQAQGTVWLTRMRLSRRGLEKTATGPCVPCCSGHD